MRFIAVLAWCLLMFMQPSHAAPPDCDAAREGTIIYNKDSKLVQFCNGTDWIGMVAQIGGTGDTLDDLNCQNDEVPVWNGAAWVCGTGGGDSLWSDSGSGYLIYDGDKGVKLANITGMGIPEYSIGDLGCANNEILKWDGTNWACASDDGGADTLAALSCASGEVAKWNGTVWACAADSSGSGGITALTGDVTASGAGSIAATIAANAVTNAKMADDAIGIDELSATGTASATTYLRGDNTWAVPAGGGSSVPGTLCGIARKYGSCAQSCGSGTYTSLATCNGASVISSCPSDYTLRTFITGSEYCGDSEERLTCIRICSKN